MFYCIDPTADLRWPDFISRHPKASIFHSAGWLSALRRTYGYEPIAVTTSAPEEQLSSALVFCRINSWVTGHRFVSLPFSDHCAPLVNSAEEMHSLVGHMQRTLEAEEGEYLELRPLEASFDQSEMELRLGPSATYFLHKLDLRPNLDDLFRTLDKDSVQRRIHRAERAGLAEKLGRSEDLLKDFYRLLVVTRARHAVPPAPYAWFQNLIQCHSEALEIRVAYLEETAIAAILTLRFQDVLYYKYGCSDAHFHQYGAMPWLLWRAVAASQSTGATEFDMGRTERNNQGLLAFKNHWVPRPQQLVYWRYPYQSGAVDLGEGWKAKLARGAFSCLPNGLLEVTGKLLYRHIG